jgi:hypothetical protein
MANDYVSKGSFSRLIESGLLQEINRRFLHPIGAEMSATQSGPDGFFVALDVTGLGEDERKAFGEASGFGRVGEIRADSFRQMWDDMVSRRHKALGFVDQPVVPMLREAEVEAKPVARKGGRKSKKGGSAGANMEMPTFDIVRPQPGDQLLGSQI